MRSNGRVEDWVQLWWNDASGKAWCGHKLKVLEPKDLFDLPNNETLRLWVPPLAAMETVVELFNEDHLAHPHTPPCVCYPSFDDTLLEKATVKRFTCFTYCESRVVLLALFDACTSHRLDCFAFGAHSTLQRAPEIIRKQEVHST